jgi:hypothetical protein
VRSKVVGPLAPTTEDYWRIPKLSSLSEAKSA